MTPTARRDMADKILAMVSEAVVYDIRGVERFRSPVVPSNPGEVTTTDVVAETFAIGSFDLRGEGGDVIMGPEPMKGVAPLDGRMSFDIRVL